LAKTLHPDRVEGNRTAFQMFQSAADTLLDATRRDVYDRRLATGDDAGEDGNDDSPDSSSVDNVIQLGGASRPSEALLKQMEEIKEKFVADGCTVAPITAELKARLSGQIDKYYTSLKSLIDSLAAQRFKCSHKDCKFTATVDSLPAIHAHLATHSNAYHDWISDQPFKGPLKVSHITTSAIQFEVAEMLQIYDQTVPLGMKLLDRGASEEIIRVARLSQLINEKMSKGECFWSRKRNFQNGSDLALLHSAVASSTSNPFPRPRRTAFKAPIESTNPDLFRRFASLQKLAFRDDARRSSASSYSFTSSATPHVPIVDQSKFVNWPKVPIASVTTEDRPAWLYDNSYYLWFNCVDCGQGYSLLLPGQRHHCRACGKEVCTACSLKPGVRDAKHGHTVPVPVCRFCVPTLAVHEFNALVPSLYDQDHVEDSLKLAHALADIYGDPTGDAALNVQLSLPSVDLKSGGKLLYHEGTGPDATVSPLVHLVLDRVVSLSDQPQRLLASSETSNSSSPASSSAVSSSASASATISAATAGSGGDQELENAFIDALKTSDMKAIVWALNGNKGLWKLFRSAIARLSADPAAQKDDKIRKAIASACYILEELGDISWNPWEMALDLKWYWLASQLVMLEAANYSQSTTSEQREKIINQANRHGPGYMLLLLSGILNRNASSTTREICVEALLTTARLLNNKNEQEMNLWMDILGRYGFKKLDDLSIDSLVFQLYRSRSLRPHCEVIALHILAWLPEIYHDEACLQNALESLSRPSKSSCAAHLYLGFMMGSSELISLPPSTPNSKKDNTAEHQKLVSWAHSLASVWFIGSVSESHENKSSLDENEMTAMMNRALRSSLQLMCLARASKDDGPTISDSQKSLFIQNCWSALMDSVDVIGGQKISPIRLLDLLALQVSLMQGSTANDADLLISIATLQKDIGDANMVKLAENLLRFVDRNYAAFMSSNTKNRFNDVFLDFLKAHRPEIAVSLVQKKDPKEALKITLESINQAYYARNSTRMAIILMQCWHTYDITTIRELNAFLKAHFGQKEEDAFSPITSFSDRFVVYLGRAIENLLSNNTVIQGFQYLTKALEMSELLPEEQNEMIEVASTLLASPFARLGSLQLLLKDLSSLRQSLKSHELGPDVIFEALADKMISEELPVSSLERNIWSHPLVKALRKSELAYVTRHGRTQSHLERAMFYFDLAHFTKDAELGPSFIFASILQVSRYLILHAKSLGTSSSPDPEPAPSSSFWNFFGQSPQARTSNPPSTTTQADQYAALQVAIQYLLLPTRNLDPSNGLRFTQSALGLTLHALEHLPWAFTAGNTALVTLWTGTVVRLAPTFPLLRVGRLGSLASDALLTELALLKASQYSLQRQAEVICGTFPCQDGHHSAEENNGLAGDSQDEADIRRSRVGGSKKLTLEGNLVLSKYVQDSCQSLTPAHVLAYYIFEGRWRQWYYDIDIRQIENEVELQFALQAAQSALRSPSARVDVVLMDEEIEKARKKAEEERKSEEIARRLDSQQKAKLLQSCQSAMAELLASKGWNFSQVEALIRSYPVPRDAAGFYTVRRAGDVTPAVPNAKWKCIRGVTIDLHDGSISVHADTAKRGEIALTSMDDVLDSAKVGKYGGAFFSLDHPQDSDAEGGITMASHPFQKMRFGPSQLRDSGLLATMFHTDYLLKMFTSGVELSSAPPFATRPLSAGLISGLPPALASCIEDYSTRQKRKEVSEFAANDANLHRFWIEAGEIEMHEVSPSSSTKVTYWFGDVDMKVKKHLMKINEQGHMEDDEDGDDNASTNPEAKFAALLTSRYADLSKAFPEFARLRELQKALAIGTLVARHALGAAELLKPSELPALKSKLRPACQQSLDHLLKQLPSTFPQRVSASEVDEHYRKTLSSANVSASQVPAHQKSELISKIRFAMEEACNQANQSLRQQVREVLTKYGIPSHALDAQVTQVLVNRKVAAAVEMMLEHEVEEIRSKKRQFLERVKAAGWSSLGEEFAMEAAASPLSATSCSWVPAAFAQHSHALNQEAREQTWTVYGGVRMDVNFTAKLLNPPSTSQFAMSTVTLNAQRGNAIANSAAQLQDNMRLNAQLAAQRQAQQNQAQANANAQARQQAQAQAQARQQAQAQARQSSNSKPTSYYAGRKALFLSIVDGGPNAKHYSKEHLAAIQKSVDDARAAGKSYFKAPVVGGSNGYTLHFCHKQARGLGGSNDPSNAYFGPSHDNLKRSVMEKEVIGRKRERERLAREGKI
jgi:hypothetical protein